MKIEQPRGVNAVQTYQKLAGRRPEMETREAANRDRIEISSEALELQGKDRIAAERAGKVDALKRRIEAGQYTIDHKAVAEKMIAYWKNVRRP